MVIVVIVTIVTSGVRLLRDACFYGDCPQQMKLSRFALSMVPRNPYISTILYRLHFTPAPPLRGFAARTFPLLRKQQAGKKPQCKTDIERSFATGKPLKVNRVHVKLLQFK